MTLFQTGKQNEYGHLSEKPENLQNPGTFRTSFDCQNSVDLSPSSILPEVTVSSAEQRACSSARTQVSSNQNGRCIVVQPLSEQKFENYRYPDPPVQYTFDGKPSSPGSFHPQPQFVPVWQMLVYPFTM